MIGPPAVEAYPIRGAGRPVPKRGPARAEGGRSKAKPIPGGQTVLAPGTKATHFGASNVQEKGRWVIMEDK